MKTHRGLSLTALGLLAIGALGGGERSLLANEPPVAEAGLSRYVAQDPIQLDGRRSYDPDHSGPLSYVWSQVSGPPVTLAAANTATPSISGFVQTEGIQVCEFELIVNDGEQASPPDRVKVTIVPTFTGSTMTLENAAFDPQKPTVIFFHGGSLDGTGGGAMNSPVWSEKANVISFPRYVSDMAGAIPETGNQPGRRYERPTDMVIAYLSAAAPDYRQPIQTMGFSLGGLPALDVALRLNLTYADARYAANHVTLLDPSAWALGMSEYRRRVAELLAKPVDREQCWIDVHEAANASVASSALNVVFAPEHSLPWNWYRTSLATLDAGVFNHGLVAGAYWSVVGPGRNLQLALTTGLQVYKFRWTGSATAGQLTFFDETVFPGRFPEPVTLGGWAHTDAGGAVDGTVLSCDESENAVGYQLLFGSDPDRVMDYRVISDTPIPPTEVFREFPPGQTWWTIRARDAYGSTIHADPVRLDLTSLPLMLVKNARTGKKYSLIRHALRDAKAGDVILLDPATYQENIEYVKPSVTVSSLDPNNPLVVAGTILRGRYDGPTVTFAGSASAGCLLAGLTIQGRMVVVSCRDAVPTIRNCTVESPDGIALEFWIGEEPRVIDCTLRGRVKEGGDPGLLAYWRLDETEGALARDNEGSNDGTVLGNPLWQPDGGKLKGALRLNGTDNAISTPSILNPGKTPFSVFLWVQGGALGQVLLSQIGAANWLRAAPTSGVLRTELNEPGRNASKHLSSAVVITDGAWHRVGLVWDGTNRLLYVDDVEVARGTLTGLSDSPEGLYLGTGSKRETGTFWSGLIDDVRIYNRAVKP